MAIRLLGWQEAISDAAPAWAQLVAASNLNPSLHPAWMNAAIESHGLAAKSRLAILDAAGGTPAFIPFFTHTTAISTIPMRCIDLGSNVVSYHAELIAAGRLEAVIGEVLSARQLPAWDVLRFGNLAADGATARAIKQVAGAMKFPVFTYPGENSPYIQMTGDWEQYLRTLSKKMRANITRCQRSTQQAGETDMKWYEKGSDIGQLLADILEVERQSWKAQEATAIQSNGVELAYYQRLLPWLVDNGLTANVLYVKDRPCAYVLCAASQGWIGQLKTSFSQDVRDAGFRVIQASIEKAFELGYTHYDFLGDAAPHKLRWTDKLQPHESVWVYARHFRGRMSAAIKKVVDGVRARRAARQPAAA